MGQPRNRVGRPGLSGGFLPQQNIVSRMPPGQPSSPVPRTGVGGHYASCQAEGPNSRSTARLSSQHRGRVVSHGREGCWEQCFALLPTQGLWSGLRRPDWQTNMAPSGAQTSPRALSSPLPNWNTPTGSAPSSLCTPQSATVTSLKQ